MNPQVTEAAASDPTSTGPTGPRTEAGKSRTRLNAFRHGLTSREFVFSPEDADLYTHHAAALHQHFQPLGPVETSLVTYVISAMWRLDRAAAIEEGIFALALDPDSNEDADALAPARAWLANNRSLALLTTYEARIRRALAADKAELARLQLERRNSAATAPGPEIGFVPANQESSAPTSPQPPAEFVCSAPPAAPPHSLPNGATHVVLLVKSPPTQPRRDAA